MKMPWDNWTLDNFRENLCKHYASTRQCKPVYVSGIPKDRANAIVVNGECKGYFEVLTDYDPATDLFNGNIPASTVEGIGPKYD